MQPLPKLNLQANASGAVSKVEDIFQPKRIPSLQFLFHMLATLRALILNNPTLFSCNSCGTVTVQCPLTFSKFQLDTFSFYDSLKQSSFQSVCLELYKNSSFLFNFIFWFSVLASRILAFKNTLHLPVSVTLSDEIFNEKACIFRICFLLVSKDIPVTSSCNSLCFQN